MWVYKKGQASKTLETMFHKSYKAWLNSQNVLISEGGLALICSHHLEKITNKARVHYPDNMSRYRSLFNTRCKWGDSHRWLWCTPKIRAIAHQNSGCEKRIVQFHLPGNDTSIPLSHRKDIYMIIYRMILIERMISLGCYIYSSSVFNYNFQMRVLYLRISIFTLLYFLHSVSFLRQILHFDFTTLVMSYFENGTFKTFTQAQLIWVTKSIFSDTISLLLLSNELWVLLTTVNLVWFIQQTRFG